MTSRVRLADVVHGWLWWATWERERRAGKGVVSSYKAAQRAAAALYA